MPQERLQPRRRPHVAALSVSHPLQRLLYCNGPFGDGNTGSRITNRPATGRTAERGIQIGAGRNSLALALRKNRLGTVHHRIVLKRKLYDVT